MNSRASNHSITGADRFDRKTFVLFLSVAVFIGALLISAITASKLYIITVFGYSITIPVGTSLFALTFLSTDVVSEIWGRKYSTMLVLSGFIMRIFSVCFLYIAVNIPPAPFWGNQVAYQSVLTGSSTILIAGILTYPVSQLTDIFVFHKMKERHKTRNLLWFRNIGSTFISQSVDSTVFILLAFAWSQPAPVLISMIIGQVIVKWVIALCDTPFVYMVRNIATKRPIFDIKG